MTSVVYSIQVAPAAECEIRKLPGDAQGKLFRQLEKLATTPRPHGVEKLSQDPRFWRVRVGDYRAIYFINDLTRAILILLVRHRREAYRNLACLDARLVAETLNRVALASLKGNSIAASGASISALPLQKG